MNIKEIIARLTKLSMSEGVWAEINLLLAHISDLEAENERLREGLIGAWSCTDSRNESSLCSDCFETVENALSKDKK